MLVNSLSSFQSQPQQGARMWVLLEWTKAGKVYLTFFCPLSLCWRTNFQGYSLKLTFKISILEWQLQTTIWARYFFITIFICFVYCCCSWCINIFQQHIINLPFFLSLAYLIFICSRFVKSKEKKSSSTFFNCLAMMPNWQEGTTDLLWEKL